MYPLLLCSVIAVAVILERGIHFLRAGSGLGWLDNVRISIRNRAFSEAAALIQTRRGPVAVLLKEVIEHRDLPRSELETRLSSAGSMELKRLSARLHLLELIGKIAPMLGLSGTVLGLTRTFQTVACTKFHQSWAARPRNLGSPDHDGHRIIHRHPRPRIPSPLREPA